MFGRFKMKIITVFILTFIEMVDNYQYFKLNIPEPEPLLMRKNCNDNGPSIGIMKYQLSRLGDVLTAICELDQAKQNLKYHVAWSFKKENKNVYEEQHRCQFEPANTSLVCKYIINLPTPDLVLSCKITSNNEFNSEYLTSCISEDVKLLGPPRTRRKLSMGEPEDTFNGVQWKYDVPLVEEIVERKLDTKTPIKTYILEVPPYENLTVCQEMDGPTLMMTSVTPYMHTMPQHFILDSKIDLPRVPEGSISINMFKGNASDTNDKANVLLKKCVRHVHSDRWHKCQHTLFITAEDAGGSIFFWTYERKSVKCNSDIVLYYVFSKSSYIQHIITQERNEEILKQEEEVFKRKNQLIDREKLPWDTQDMNEGPKFSGKQCLLLFFGLLALLSMPPCCFSIFWILKRRQGAEACYCNAIHKYRNQLDDVTSKKVRKVSAIVARLIGKVRGRKPTDAEGSRENAEETPTGVSH